ncbi:hypothetical protein HHK36_009398 [Tetracentron sinense]|uniref:Uncharacterized protein n=1 Tax=Tetracentron sinense TaxID=13715 RepID=A0A834ZG72_TETSI|nr:hypothetical protein HHK36_009398 [Tetracentron sinense]
MVKSEVIAHEPPPDQIGDEPVSIGDILEDTNLVSRDKSNGVHHMLFVNDVAKDKVIEHEDGNLPLHGGDFTHSDKTEEASTNISTEPTLLSLKECSQMESEPVHISESNQGSFHENAGQLLCVPVGLSSSSMETVSTTQNEPQAVMDNRATQEYPEELGVCLVLHDSTTRENDGDEVVEVSHEKQEEASLKVAGVDDNETMKAYRSGGVDPHGNQPGQEDPVFLREGPDIHVGSILNVTQLKSMWVTSGT